MEFVYFLRRMIALERLFAWGVTSASNAQVVRTVSCLVEAADRRACIRRDRPVLITHEAVVMAPIPGSPRLARKGTV
jgi:hypothetical protein